MATSPRDQLIVLKPERLLAGAPTSGVLDKDGVHDFRRISKQARALLRFAEDAGRREAAPVRRATARAARPLAPLRDAAVVAKLAGKLAAKLKGREREVARAIAAMPVPERPVAWWGQQWRRFAKVRTDIARLEETPVSPAEVAIALERSVRRACKRAERVHPGRQFKRAHAWRKSVKLLRSQLQAAPLQSVSLRKLSDQLKQVAHCLGVAADHEAFMAAVEAHPWPRKLRKPVKSVLAISREKQTAAVKRACKCWAKLEPKLNVLRKP